MVLSGADVIKPNRKDLFVLNPIYYWWVQCTTSLQLIQLKVDN
jgi:hypothetical protein